MSAIMLAKRLSGYQIGEVAMAKYRGKDGWLYDDSAENSQHAESEEKAQESAPKKKHTKCPNCHHDTFWRRLEGLCTYCGWVEGPPTEQPDPTIGPRSSCPNCCVASSWRRLEGVCKNCGWGKKKSEVRANDGGACCAAFGIMAVCPLIGAGIGYAAMGFGGMLIGGGLGVAAPIALTVWAATTATRTRQKGSK